MPSSLFSWHIIFMVGHLFLSSCFVHCTCIRLCAHKRMQATTVQTSRPTLRCKRLSFCPSSMHMSCTSPSFFISEPMLVEGQLTFSRYSSHSIPLSYL